MTRIEQRLRDVMGLDANSIGSSAVQRTIRLRMKASGLQNADEYAALLDSSSTEWSELIESVVVTETWFFRDRESFNALVRLVKEEWLLAHPTGTLRILSVPCSSGEEPYSLVMALLEAEVRPERFRVDAADISERALDRAREGFYTRNSFRGKDLAFRDRYFHAVKNGFAIDASVREKVSFFQGNLVNQKFPFRALYDVIFCRNLLIYFDRPTQRKALEQINRLLVTSGVLFVGPAEQPLIANCGFVPLGMAMAFASRKTNPGNGRARPATFLKPSPRTVAPRPAPPPPPNISFAPLLSPKPTHAAANDLETVRMLADAGNLKEASAMCEAFLRTHSSSAHAWYLLGLLREAAGDGSAVSCYRKALYLDPNHYETLLQMALLSERDGNTAHARTFRNRAERLKSKTLRQS